MWVWAGSCLQQGDLVVGQTSNKRIRSGEEKALDQSTNTSAFLFSLSLIYLIIRFKIQPCYNL